MENDRSFARALAQVFRLEYVYATLPGMTITFFLCARSPTALLSLPVVEGLLIVAFVIFAGLGINAVVDRDIDRKYASHKNRTPDAIEIIGLRRTWLIIALQIALAVVLSLHVGQRFDSRLPLALVLAEAFFGYGYSIPPLQFKLRGVFLHGVSLVLSTGFIPFVISAYTYLGTISASLMVFIVGFALVQYGFEFSNQALDYLEDRQEGLQTPAVRLGVVRSIAACLIVPLCGMAVAALGMYLLLHERRASLGMGPSLVDLHVTFGLTMAAMAVGYYLPVRNTLRMYALCRREPPETSVPQLPRFCRYAMWQASSVSGVAAACGIFFVATNYLW